MTVGELKQRMTAAELTAWVRYVNEFGPLNLAWRIDFAVARAAAPFMGKDITPKNLMVWPKIEEQEATPEDVLSLLRGAKKREEVANG